MLKILKHGIKSNEEYCECRYCKCEFTYEKKDLNFTKNILGQEIAYINCPECNENLTRYVYGI